MSFTAKSRETLQAPKGRHEIARDVRNSLNSQLTQISWVGAHSRAPYKTLIKQGLWEHGCTPLQASIKIKQSFKIRGVSPWKTERQNRAL